MATRQTSVFVRLLLCGSPILVASTKSTSESCATRDDQGGQQRCTRTSSLMQLDVRSGVVDSSWSDSEGDGVLLRARGSDIVDRFCGIASNDEQNNNWGSEELEVAAADVSAGKLWHYNWRMTSPAAGDGVRYVPMIKQPGRTGSKSIDDLPAAFQADIGGVVKGWNEPDDPGQAGKDYDLRSLKDPKKWAQMWTADMTKAKAKGYTEFIGPAMAHDVCWLDHFLKACEETSGCRDLVTYLAFHRYRADCGRYKAESSYRGWREDLSYALSFYNLMLKYNRRGFNIKGLVWDELGCFTSDWSRFAPEEEQMQYMREWYNRTVVSVKLGDPAMEQQIKNTDWIMPVAAGTADDAHRNPTYRIGDCRAERSPTAAADAVQALRSIVSMAWFSIQPKTNHLFTAYSGSKRLSRLGELYFSSCNRLAGGHHVTPPSPPLAPQPTPAPLPSDTCDEAAWPDKDHGLVCGECKVLVNRFDSAYGTCSNYCAKVGRRCVGAWEEWEDTCSVLHDITCEQRLSSSDAICECGDLTGSTSPQPAPSPPPTPEPATTLAPMPAPTPEPAPQPQPSSCDEAAWPDKDHGLVCGECKVLVNRFDSEYGSCSNYCGRVGRRCTAAWEERGDTCDVLHDMTCDQELASSDAICECGAELAQPPWPQPVPLPTPAPAQGGSCDETSRPTKTMDWYAGRARS